MTNAREEKDIYDFRFGKGLPLTLGIKPHASNENAREFTQFRIIVKYHDKTQHIFILSLPSVTQQEIMDTHCSCTILCYVIKLHYIFEFLLILYASAV